MILRSDEEYAPIGQSVLPAGGDDVLVIDPEDGSRCLLPHTLGNMLRVLHGFRRPEEHLAELIRRGWQDDGSGYLRECLNVLHSRGVLRSRSEFLHRVLDRAGAPSEQAAGRRRITTAAWATCGRAAVLRRGLAGLLANLRQYDRRVRLAVFDDSPGRELRESLVRFARDEQVPLEYCGIAEKKDFLGRLAGGRDSRLPGREVLELALFGDPAAGLPYGANGNAELLGTVGEMALHADDDMELRIGIPPREEAGCELCTVSDPSEFYFYPDRETLLAGTEEAAEDWLLRHESLLGRKASDWLAGLEEAGSALRVDRLSPGLLREMEAGRGRIRVTMPGQLGDSGAGGPFFLMMLDGVSRERLTVSPEAYESAFRSREIYRGVRRSTVADGNYFMGGHYGFDNRDLLPPFFPNGRGQDGIFFQTLKACADSCLIAYLPRTVLHSPDPPRVYQPEQRFETRPRLSEIILALVRFARSSLRWESPAEAMAALGRRLLEAGASSDSSFRSLVTDLWAREWCGRIGHLNDLLERHRGPDYWARDMERLIESLRGNLRDPDQPFPVDLPRGRTPREALRLTRELVGRFGELLQGWPAVVERAGELRAEGRGLTVTLE